MLEFKTLVGNHYLMTRIRGNSKTGEAVMVSVIPAAGLDLETIRNQGSNSCPDTCPNKHASGKRKTGTCYTYKRPGGSQGVLGGLQNAYLNSKTVPMEEWLEKTTAAASLHGFLRAGEYGDPSITPEVAAGTKALLKNLKELDVTYTCYTHMWRKDQTLKGLAMASVESPKMTEEANAAGWLSFEVVPRNSPEKKLCPAQQVKKFTCAQCGLCDGSSKNVKIRLH
jgi:hypothetical protein